MPSIRVSARDRSIHRLHLVEHVLKTFKAISGLEHQYLADLLESHLPVHDRAFAVGAPKVHWTSGLLAP